MHAELRWFVFPFYSVARRNRVIAAVRSHNWSLHMRLLPTLLGPMLIVGVLGCDSGGGPTKQPDAATKVPRFEIRPEKIETNDESHYMVLKSDFTFIDSTNTRWLAPAGTKTDGASIPQLFLSFIGDRFDPRYRAAAIVHDAFCQEINKSGASFQTRKWRATHKMFYEACVEGGTDKRAAQLMFAAIWLGGPRWNDEAHSLDAVPKELLKEEFEKCKEWLEKSERSNDALIAWMDRREQNLREGKSPPLTEEELE